MTAAGARGATLAEMMRTLHLTAERDVHAEMGKLLNDLNALDGKQGLAVRVANRIWATKRITIDPAFARLTKLQYHAPIATADFEKDTEGSRKAINAWVFEQTRKKINLSLPRFKARTRRRLEGDLMALGMKLAFGKADFTGITRTLPLSISAVIHEAVIEVNEEGTKAAAATAVVMRGGGMPHPIPTVRADHPFLYVIRDPSSGVILFVGRVANPTVE